MVAAVTGSQHVNNGFCRMLLFSPGWFWITLTFLFFNIFWWHFNWSQISFWNARFRGVFMIGWLMVPPRGPLLKFSETEIHKSWSNSRFHTWRVQKYVKLVQNSIQGTPLYLYRCRISRGVHFWTFQNDPNTSWWFKFEKTQIRLFLKNLRFDGYGGDFFVTS